ncbi:hypothetical protein [Dysgonomonas massiliensis]|uniref:hypothetical protein n=1 Tax=Dysgonomonas massiliensis TaxID=2040292 RepID=UPI000C7847BA|nr:hypothetical protein [Dysgonomonas massiliensis]
MKLEKNKFYSFKIKDRKQEEFGFLIEEDEEWYLIRHLFTDYMIDGYMLINKSYVSKVNRDDKAIFTENVLIANKKTSYSLDMNIPLTTEMLFKYIFEKQIVIQIDNKDENKCWIGKILDSTNKSIFLTPISPVGEWDTAYYTFRKKNIRLISFDSDYINSLLKYNESIEN